MKIGFDAKRANANKTGLGNYSRFVIAALSEYAPENNYQLYVPKRKQNREYDQLFSDFPAIEERLPRGWFGRKFSSLWRSRGISQDLKSEGVEIYHGLSNEIPSGLASLGIKSVVTIHDLIFRRVPSNYKMIDRWIYDNKFRYACENSDRIIAVSECTKRDIVDLYNIDPAKIEVIYQGCAPIFAERFDESHKEKIRERYDLPKRFILSVGTLEERKNLQLMVESLEHLPEDISLVACGRATPYTKRVMEYAKLRGLTHRIKLIHKSDYFDLPVIYQCAEVFIYPSRYEGFGIPIIEAMSCGIPVVAATGSCLEEAGGEAALYVSPDDPKALATSVIRLIGDSTLRDYSIALGAEYIRKFDKSVIAEQIKNLYKSLK